MPPSKLLLYPQLLLTCFAMLPTTYMHLYALIIDLLQKAPLSCRAQSIQADFQGSRKAPCPHGPPTANAFHGCLSGSELGLTLC